ALAGRAPRYRIRVPSGVPEAAACVRASVLFRGPWPADCDSVQAGGPHMRTLRFVSLAAVVFGIVQPVVSEARRCPSDSRQVGDVCVDEYESSVWSTTDSTTIRKIQKGKVASTADLVAATQHGVAGDDYGAGCPDTADGCVDYYAVSL